MLSYIRNVSFHPIIDFDITDKVKKGVAILGADEASTLPYLLEHCGKKCSLWFEISNVFIGGIL